MIASDNVVVEGGGALNFHAIRFSCSASGLGSMKHVGQLLAALRKKTELPRVLQLPLCLMLPLQLMTPTKNLNPLHQQYDCNKPEIQAIERARETFKEKNCRPHERRAPTPHSAFWKATVVSLLLGEAALSRLLATLGMRDSINMCANL